jgi:hypothetical protein
MDGKRADEQAAHEPHCPGAAADARRAVFLPQVDYLGYASIAIAIPAIPRSSNTGSSSLEPGIEDKRHVVEPAASAHHAQRARSGSRFPAG